MKEPRAPERSWVLPDEPVPVRLMSTVWADSAGIHDEFTSPADLDAWLDAIGVDRHGRTASPADLARARDLRDAVRRLAAHVTADDRVAAGSAIQDVGHAADVLNAAASAAPAWRLTVRTDGLSFGPEQSGSPIAAGMAEVAAQSQQLLGQESRTLRACHAPGCVLYFVKTHPRREWCSVACGNRARAARHYRSVRSASAGG